MQEPTAADIIPIQNFMRRFSHVDPDQEESSKASEDEGEAALAVAAVAEQPSLSERFKNLFKSAPAPEPPREPTRADFILLPLLKAKKWAVEHPKGSMTIIVLLLATVVDRMPYYQELHDLACWCIEDEDCPVGFVLRRMKFLILCLE